jgi:energy-coupling factor transporter ATP-binding protein EcfA2
MKRYALVIGIAEYDSRNLPNLAKPATDAEAIAQLLEQYGNLQEVRRLPANWLSADRCEVGRTPLTAQELSAELKRFLLEQAVKGEALVYFSGHGFVVSDSLGGSEAFLATSDTRVEVQNGQVVSQQNAISLRSLNNLLMQADLGSLVVLLDCCHAGSLLQKELVQQALASSATQRDYALIAACRGFEKSYEGEEQVPHSIFTTALLKGLSREQAGSSGQVSSDRVAAIIDEELKGKGQEPIRMNWGRPITLVNYPKITEKPAISADFKPENPYRGLYTFEEEHAALFHGRERASWDLLSYLLENRFLAVIGASGSGKSSLVKAGLLPKLRQGRISGSDQWQIRSMNPGRHPHRRLMEILEKLPATNRSFFLFIDQFEEVFTLCEDEIEKQNFMRLLVRQVEAADCDLRIVVAIRADFLGKCADYDIADLINRSRPTGYVVKPLSRKELEEAIAQPAAQHGVTFQDGLVQQVTADVLDRPGALPLLQYALKELWHTCIETPDNPQMQLTWAGYDEIGRVGGALEKRANLLYDSFNEPEQAFFRRLFVEELVQLGDQQTVTRRRTTWARLGAIAPDPDLLRSVVGQLADQRMVVTDETTVEVAHEFLLTKWNLLRDWIEQDREQSQLRQRLEASYQDWRERYQQADDALLSGALLASIEENLNWRELPEMEYVRKSLEWRDREHQAQLEQERQLREVAEARARAEEERKLIEIEKAIEAEARAKAEAEKAHESSRRVSVEKQRNRWLSLAAVGLTILTGISFGLKQQADQARTQYERAVVDVITAKPLQLFEAHKQIEALLESIKALKTLEQASVDQQSALDRLQPIFNHVREQNRLQGHNRQVNEVSFSPDGNTLASASSDKTVKLWSKEGKLLGKPLHHDAKVWAIEFSYSGKRIASGDENGVLWLWNIENAQNAQRIRKFEPDKSLRDEERLILSVSFSPDDQVLATANWDKTVKLWRVSDGTLLKTLPHSGKVFGVKYSPDGRMLASGSDDKRVRVWDAQTGKLLKTFTDEDEVDRVSFSPDNQWVVSSGRDKSVKLWNVSGNGSPIKFSHGDRTFQATFSADGRLIASAGFDETVKVWQIADQKLLATYWHDDQVNSVKFSPTEPTLVSTSDDKTIRVWTLKPLQLQHNNPKKAVEDICFFLKNYLQNNQNYQTNPENQQICMFK